MKFNVSSSKLFSQLQAVSRVIPPKSSLTILEGVLFRLEGNQLELTASDGETTIRTSMEVEGAEGAGKVVFGAKLLLDTLKEFPEQPLVFQIDENNFGLNITSENGAYSFVGSNGNEYPEMTQEEGGSTFEMQADTLMDAINKTIFCTADDELRPVMNGIYFDLQADHLAMVATDAHRLVRYINTAITTNSPMGFILPKKPANLLKSVLVKEQGMVAICCGEKNARFVFGTTTIVCRQIEGRFPSYEAVIPKNNTNVVVVDRQTILNACKRVAVFASSSTSLLKLSMQENILKISAQDIDFSTSAEEVIACSYNDSPMSIGFQARFLVEILGNLSSQEIMLQLADPARPGLILPTENEENQTLLMLLMPMLLSE